MMLSDRDLEKAIRDEELQLDGASFTIQPASIDLTLGEYLRIESSLGRFEEWELEYGEEFTIAPGEFVLAHTEQWIELSPSLAARCEGKSTLGRLGLMVHCTAGFIDPGFKGQITLELFNLSKSPIILAQGMKIAQLSVFRLSSPAERPYGSPGLGSKYQGQTGATEAR